ncbi:uncharacterized protein LOC119728438 [Patiria miniata]|uniref:Tetraspanin n=1 Tax=Patiria miniata TaxID=46514 RepID=A0A913ZZV8_PATMI|nr:uncharacterized protein LOC119728438 [Patiria miniata]
MNRKGLRDKFFAIVIHVCGMVFAITAVHNRTMPYVTLFPWLVTDFRLIYVKVVITNERLFLLVHVLECFQFCLHSDTNNDTEDMPTMSMILAINDKLPYPHLFEGLEALQMAIYVCTILNECVVLLTNLLEKSSPIENHRSAVKKVYISCLIISVCLAAGGFLGFHIIFGNNIKGTVEPILYDHVTELYGMPGYAADTDAINRLQINEKCCGATGYADYFNSYFASSPMYGGRVLPVTCFKLLDDGCVNATSADKINISKIYIKGCNDALVAMYEYHYRMLFLPICTAWAGLYDGYLRLLLLRKRQPKKYEGRFALRVHSEPENQDQEIDEPVPGAGDVAMANAPEPETETGQPFLKPGTSSRKSHSSSESD